MTSPHPSSPHSGSAATADASPDRTSLDLEAVRAGGIRLTGSLAPDARLVLMGHSGDVGALAHELGRHSAVASIDAGELGLGHTTRTDWQKARVGKVLARAEILGLRPRALGLPLATVSPPEAPAFPVTAEDVFVHFSLDVPGILRKRLGELAVDTRIRLLLALVVARGLRTGAEWILLRAPFERTRGGVRAGLRSRLLTALEHFRLGAIVASNDVVDASLLGGRVLVVEKDQLADDGDLAAILAQPRSNVAAGIRGVNVFSGLARRGWLSIGHSQVKARTELDGKVFATVPTSAITLSLDEDDPAFDDSVVFEGVVVAIRDKGTTQQVTLSPSDTEVGLAITADLFDFASPEVPSGILHPGLGDTVVAQQEKVRVGTRVFAQVDTSTIDAYPVDKEISGPDSEVAEETPGTGGIPGSDETPATSGTSHAVEEPNSVGEPNSEEAGDEVMSGDASADSVSRHDTA